jgi:di/tricarboxylate transporter
VMSDTGTVAVLLPAIVSIARGTGISPSRLLMPLSFGALLGGAATLIGTPPNIIVSDLLRTEGLPPFEFFDYTPIGLILLAVGVTFMLLAGRRLLPNYQPRQELERFANPQELVALYRLPDNLFRLRVRRGSELVGQTVAASRLRQDFGVTALKILRSPQPRARMRPSASAESITPSAGTVLQVDDVLLVQGQGDDVLHAAAFWNLGVQPAEDEGALVNQEVGLAEVLLPPRSGLLDKTLVELGFGTRYKLTVLGLNRPGTADRLDLKQTRLSFGDILLVQGPWQHILALRRQRRDFVVMGQPEDMVGAPQRKKAPLTLLILAGMLALMVTNAVPLATASMLAALATVLTGCLSMDEAYEAIDWKSVVLIAGMLPMSLALEKVDLVQVVAQGLTDSLGDLGPRFVIAGLFLLTSAFTQVLSNTATTVLIAPVALAAANGLGVRPFSFLMTVAIAASMAFASPVASPVNTLVMGAGNYRFGDYIKVGAPLILIMLLVVVAVLPVLWPL